MSGEWQAELYNVYAFAARYTMNIGDESPVQVSATLEDATHLNLQQYPPLFASSDEAVATINDRGMITAVGSGAATITCTVNYGGQSKAASVAIAVKSAK